MKYKVGDRVEHEKYGLGTVAESHSCKPYILVKFDKPHSDLHGGDKPARHNQHWWYMEDGTYCGERLTLVVKEGVKKLKAYDLMKLAAENPQEYEGKRYKVLPTNDILGAPIRDFEGCAVEKIKISNGILFIDKPSASNCTAFVDNRAELEEINPQPVPFLEAIKAYGEGKTIKCDVNGTASVYEPVVWAPKHCAMKGNDSKLGPCAVEILEGTWYIID